MNILHVVNIYFVIPYFLGDQLLYFKKRGYQEYIICSPSDEIKQYSESHCFGYKEIPIERKISLWKDIKAIVATCKYVHEKRISIVTGHTPKGALIAMIAGFFMRVPIRIYFRHGLVYETSMGFKRKLLIWIDRLVAKLSTKIVCVSPSICNKSLEDKLNPSYKQILLSKGTCNGIDIFRFNKENIDNVQLNILKRRLGLDKYSFVIGFTGRLVRDKGIIELIQAFDILQKKSNDIAVLLVGMLETRDALPQNIVENIETNPAIVSTGYVENSMIEYYYGLMDIFVLPSYREGFPTSVLEDSSMELPIVTTKATGCIDSIVEKETGLFVGHNAGELAETIWLLRQDGDIRNKYGKAGREFVKNNFEQHVIWQEIEMLYV